MHQTQFYFTLDPTGEACSAPQDPLAGFGGEVRGKREGKGEKRKGGREGKGREKMMHTPHFLAQSDAIAVNLQQTH